MEFHEDLMIPDKKLSLSEGAIQVMGWQSSTDPKSYTYAILKALSQAYGFSLDTPYRELPAEIRRMLIYGADREVKVYYKGQRGEGVYDVLFEGLIKNVNRPFPVEAAGFCPALLRLVCHGVPLFLLPYAFYALYG